MPVNILLLDTSKKNSEAIQKIVDVIKKGGNVVLPWGAPQREAFVLVADATNLKAVQGLNKIKGRPLNQAVGITAPPEAISKLADLENTEAIKKYSQKLRLTPLEYITKLFEQGALALIVKANNKLQAPLIKIGEDGARTVMFATEMNYRDNPIIHQVYQKLLKEGIVLGGTSANRKGEDTYAIHQQEEAIADLKDVVDLFVGYLKPKFKFKRLKFMPKFLHPLHFSSSTYFDMTKYPPVLLREGSVHPWSFRNLLPKYQKNNKMRKESLRQTRLHLFTDPLMRRLVS